MIKTIDLKNARYILEEDIQNAMKKAVNECIDIGVAYTVASEALRNFSFEQMTAGQREETQLTQPMAESVTDAAHEEVGGIHLEQNGMIEISKDLITYNVIESNSSIWGDRVSRIGNGKIWHGSRPYMESTDICWQGVFVQDDLLSVVAYGDLTYTGKFTPGFSIDEKLWDSLLTCSKEVINKDGIIFAGPEVGIQRLLNGDVKAFWAPIGVFRMKPVYWWGEILAELKQQNFDHKRTPDGGIVIFSHPRECFKALRESYCDSDILVSELETVLKKQSSFNGNVDLICSRVRSQFEIMDDRWTADIASKHITFDESIEKAIFSLVFCHYPIGVGIGGWL